MSSSQKTRNVHSFSSSAYLQTLMAELDRAHISQRIQTARVQAGITQGELGDALEPAVHWRTVQTWESAKEKVVPFDRLGEIADVTGVTKEWILHGEANDPEEHRLATLETKVDALDRRTAESFEAVERLLDDIASRLPGRAQEAGEA